MQEEKINTNREYLIVIQEDESNNFVKHFKLSQSNLMECDEKCLPSMEIETSIQNKSTEYNAIFHEIKEELDNENNFGANDISVCSNCYEVLILKCIAKLEIIHECSMNKKELEEEREKYKKSLSRTGLTKKEIEHLADCPF